MAKHQNKGPREVVVAPSLEVQGQFGCRSDQPGPVEGVLLHSSGVGTRMIFKDPFQAKSFNDSILFFPKKSK